MDATDKPFLSLHAESTITIVPNSSNAFADAPTGGGTQFRWRTGRTRTRMSNYGCVRVCVSCTIDFSIWSISFFSFFLPYRENTGTIELSFVLRNGHVANALMLELQKKNPRHGQNHSSCPLSALRSVANDTISRFLCTFVDSSELITGFYITHCTFVFFLYSVEG